MIVSASQNYQPPIKCPGLSGRPIFAKNVIFLLEEVLGIVQSAGSTVKKKIVRVPSVELLSF